MQKEQISPQELYETLSYLKEKNSFDRLNTIIGLDLSDKFELIYDLYSTKAKENKRLSVFVDRTHPNITSVVEIYPSAYFDECEIFDMFGIVFKNNPNLKRLLMPKGWKGYPLRKDYVQDDERLAWNND